MPGCFGHDFVCIPFIQVFTLRKEKWKDYQAMLCNFLKGNPSPVCQPWPSLSTASSSAVAFANLDASVSTATQGNHQTFNAMSFMQQFSATMIVTQKFQMIVVESRTNKCHKSKVKFNNNMLQLLLVGGASSISRPLVFLSNFIFLLNLFQFDPLQRSTFSGMSLMRSPRRWPKGLALLPPINQCIISQSFLLQPSQLQLPANQP
jgi:hypothetical protein